MKVLLSEAWSKAKGNIPSVSSPVVMRRVGGLLSALSFFECFDMVECWRPHCNRPGPLVLFTDRQTKKSTANRCSHGKLPFRVN